MNQPIIVKEFVDESGNILPDEYKKDLILFAQQKISKMKSLWFTVDAYGVNGKTYKGLLKWNVLERE